MVPYVMHGLLLTTAYQWWLLPCQGTHPHPELHASADSPTQLPPAPVHITTSLFNWSINQFFCSFCLLGLIRRVDGRLLGNQNAQSTITSWSNVPRRRKTAAMRVMLCCPFSTSVIHKEPPAATCSWADHKTLGYMVVCSFDGIAVQAKHLAPQSKHCV